MTWKQLRRWCKTKAIHLDDVQYTGERPQLEDSPIWLGINNQHFKILPTGQIKQKKCFGLFWKTTMKKGRTTYRGIQQMIIAAGKHEIVDA